MAGTSAKALDTAGLDLGLGGDQLAGEVRLGRRSGRRRLDVLEPVDEVERDGVEQRELLLHGDGEVGTRVEPLARVAEKLICGNALFVAHGAEKTSRCSTFDSDEPRLREIASLLMQPPGPSRKGSSSRRETPAQLQRSTTAARAAARSAARSSAGS